MDNKNECCNNNCKEDNECCKGNGLSSSNVSGVTYSSDFNMSDMTLSFHSSIPFSIPKPKIEDILIREMNYGYLVKIGCQTIVVETPKKLVKALKKYLKDPAGVEELFMQGEFMENLE